MENKDNMVFSGSCLCKEVRFELHGLPMKYVLCHCTDCKKTGGTSFKTNVAYAKNVNIPSSTSLPTTSFQTSIHSFDFMSHPPNPKIESKLI